MSRIVIVGDLFPTENNVSFFAKGDVESLFGEKICSLFSAADFAVCNLEGALTDHQERCRKTGPVKVAPTKAVEAYKELGIDLCLLANNHATDGGHQGMLDTMQTLTEKGIAYIGAGRDKQNIVRHFTVDVGGGKLTLYNVSETMYNKPTETTAGAWLYDEYVVCREIELLKKGCDHLVVLYHGGIEKFPYPSPEMRKRFHRMADCGAEVILAQHTHCVGCEEYYNGSYLLYGQGDFLLKNFAPGLTDFGLIIELEIGNDGLTVQKHLVRSVNNRFVRYDENQDLSAFNDRSERMHDEAYVLDEFDKFCEKELPVYFTAFKNPSKLRMVQRRLFASSYKRWLFDYSERNMLFTLHTLRSEQNRETAVVGIECLLKKWWSNTL